LKCNIFIVYYKYGVVMNITELIAIASIRSGKNKGELAREMGHANQQRLSRISAGKTTAEASEIVYLAHEAKLPEVATLAEIEAERYPQLAQVWKDVLNRERKMSLVQ
jgi:hypothetical protein